MLSSRVNTKGANATFDTRGRICYLFVLVFKEPMQLLICGKGVLSSRVGTKCVNATFDTMGRTCYLLLLVIRLCSF